MGERARALPTRLLQSENIHGLAAGEREGVGVAPPRTFKSRDGEQCFFLHSARLQPRRVILSNSYGAPRRPQESLKENLKSAQGRPWRLPEAPWKPQEGPRCKAFKAGNLFGGRGSARGRAWRPLAEEPWNAPRRPKDAQGGLKTIGFTMQKLPESLKTIGFTMEKLPRSLKTSGFTME